METKLTQYTSLKGEQLRTIREGENIYFVGKDAALMLGYANTKDAISKHCKGVAKYYPIVDALGRTQRSMEKGLFRVIERTVVDANGCTRLCLTTKVTGKGQQYFINLFLKNA